MDVERPKSSATVDIWCARCGKPMMMLSFNYTSLERGFESISLRCQYCGREDTRPWPKAEALDERADQPPADSDVPDQTQDSDEAINTEVTQSDLDETHLSEEPSSSPNPNASPSDDEHMQ
jgi:DNA-directed RNA polymerase subunit RPC12/RpoP